MRRLCVTAQEAGGPRSPRHSVHGWTIPPWVSPSPPHHLPKAPPHHGWLQQFGGQQGPHLTAALPAWDARHVSEWTAKGSTQGHWPGVNPPLSGHQPGQPHTDRSLLGPHQATTARGTALGTPREERGRPLAGSCLCVLEGGQQGPKPRGLGRKRFPGKLAA